jgi:hypothetical protein
MSKRPYPVSDEAGLLAKVRGEADLSVRHDVTRYTWWSFHDGSNISHDRSFPTRKMALLYVAKRNSEELTLYLEASDGKLSWKDLFGEAGSPYALTPNTAFDLAAFIEMEDNAIEEYGNGCADAFCRHKVERGLSHRYAPRQTEEVSEEELLRILKRDKPSQAEQDHSKRQALLLSDIAGFD